MQADCAELSNISYATTLLLSITSGCVLFYALYKIKQSLKTQPDAHANIKAMTLHATSFGLYMLSAVMLVGILLANLRSEYDFYVAWDQFDGF